MLGFSGRIGWIDEWMFRLNEYTIHVRGMLEIYVNRSISCVNRSIDSVYPV
jgi:hypothetical protein